MRNKLLGLIVASASLVFMGCPNPVSGDNPEPTGLVSMKGIVTTLAGIPNDDGIGISANFDFPIGIATDGTNLYVADSSHGAKSIHYISATFTNLFESAF